MAISPHNFIAVINILQKDGTSFELKEFLISHQVTLHLTGDEAVYSSPEFIANAFMSVPKL